MSWGIRRGDEHPTWGATWIDLGSLRLIWCAPSIHNETLRDKEGRVFPNTIAGHPNVWMIVWRRKLPEWDQESWERRRRPHLTLEARAAAREKDERRAAEARETARAEQAAKIVSLDRGSAR
jgi:hypothetical protein